MAFTGDILVMYRAGSSMLNKQMIKVARLSNIYVSQSNEMGT
jgi:hypothetical protein